VERTDIPDGPDKRAVYQNCSRYYDLIDEGGPDPEGRGRLYEFIEAADLVLDVGCGTGANRPYLPAGARYVGVDVSPVARARSAASHDDETWFVAGDSARLPFRGDSFDAVISTYSMEHFADPRHALDEILRVCRPHGRIVLVSPAWERPSEAPPSLDRQMASPGFRIRYVLTRTLRLLRMCIDRRRCYFTTIPTPVIDPGDYVPDSDAVYILCIREIVNYFVAKGATVRYVRTVVRRYRRPLLRHLWYNMKTLLKNAPHRKYFGTRLFLVVEKAGDAS